MISESKIIKSSKHVSHAEVNAIRDEAIWEGLQRITIEQAINKWLAEEQNVNTRKNYQSAIGKLIELGLINPFMNLQQFSMINLNAVVIRITGLEGLARATRQARAAAFISFTRYLSLQTDGLIKRALPQRTGSNKTFYRIRKEVATEALTQAEWTRFLDELQSVNPRDALIAKLQIQGAKRISEVLKLTTDKINYAERQITFAQSKTRGTAEETTITYPQTVMEELRKYIGDRKGLVFVTRYGKRIMINQIATTYARAGKRAGIAVHSHMLRCSAITYLLGQGYSASEIKKISGHASVDMVTAYDKRSKADNPTRRVSLVN